MPNLYRRDYPSWWWPNADASTAPAGGLLRADNLVPDEGLPSLRPGSAKINTTALGTPSRVESLFTAHLGGTRYRVAGYDTTASPSGRVAVVSTTPTELDAHFAGSGQFAMGAAMGRVLLSRSTTHKEYDGTDVTNWSIAAPTEAPVLTVVNPFTKTVATCDSGDAEFTAEEGTITATYPTGEDGTSNGAIEVTPSASTGRATIVKSYGAATDFFNINGYTGSAFDLFDLPIWVQEPEKVETVTVMFGLSSTTDRYQTDYYYFDFKLGGQRQQIVDIQGGVAHAVGEVLGKASKRTTRDGIEEEIDVDERRRKRDKLEQRREDLRRERKDKASNPGWTHLACLRSQFNRVGSTSTLDWTDVQSFKIVYKAVAGSTGTVRYDNIKMHGGGNEKALTGRFKVVYRFARNCGDFYKVSPPSPESAEVVLNTQAVQATISAPAILAKDAQADEVWFYLFGGVLDRYYRTNNTVTDSGTPQGYLRTIRLNEYDQTAQGASTAADRTRRCTMGYAIPQSPTGSTRSVTVEIMANQADLLIANEFLEIGTSGPPDDMIGVVGDHHFRAFCLTAKKLIPSLPRNPCSLLPGKAIAVGSDDETAYWVAKTVGGLYVGTSVDIYHIDGDGQEFDDGTLNFSRVPLNIAFPPVSRAFALEGNQILYLAADGWRVFNGEVSNPIKRGPIDLLYKGKTRHGISPVNLSTGTFHAALSGGVMTAITPEGASTTSSTALHRYDSIREIWRRDTYPYSMTAIHRERDGTLLVGDTVGFVRQLDTGTQDDSTDISVVLWTKSDDNEQPLTRKDPFDEYVRLDTGSGTAAVALHLDGSSSAVTSYSPSSNGIGIYKHPLDPGNQSNAFRRIQHRITGSFSTFKLYDLNLAYRDRPQGRMFVDTGYIDFGNQDIVWLRELILKVDSPSNLTVKVYMDDTLVATKTVTVAANVARSYTIPLGREIKGYQPRVTIESTNSAGTGDIDFEAYWLRLKYRPSGNETEKTYVVNIPGAA